MCIELKEQLVFCNKLIVLHKFLFKSSALLMNILQSYMCDLQAPLAAVLEFGLGFNFS